MKYYDISSVEVPEWYGFNNYLKPIIIEAKTTNELRKKTQKGFAILKHPSQEVYRKAVEKSLVDVILPDRLKGHDYLHHKRTLLNNVTAKLMNKNKVSYLFTFKELLNTKGGKRALVWGRMKYELWLCVKKKVPIMIASGAENKNELVDVRSLLAMGELLGLKPDQAKSSLNYVQEKILRRGNVTFSN